MSKHLYPTPDDFQAVIRIYAANEGGRLTPAFNGVRWDFSYAGDPDNLYMIWPDFLDDNGASLQIDIPLPIDTELLARMIVVIDDMRKKVHRSRLREGVRFYCHEGQKLVAEGRVTAITGLHQACES